MSSPASSHQRLHDLDALRATAMLIGIVYHAALSFALGFPWMVQDFSQAKGIFVFQAWVHGFRMQLFMLVSGFFAALLWRQKGLKALLWHRCRRVLFPCLIGLVTVAPAMSGAVGYAVRSSASRSIPTPEEPPAASLWTALKAGDLQAMGVHLAQPATLTNLHPVFGVTPLQWAALNGRRDSVARLLDLGAPVDGRSRDGHTALHGAAFMGHAETVSLLLERGADVNAASNNGETPLHNAGLDFGTVQYIAGLLGLPVNRASWETGRPKVREQLTAAGASQGSAGSPATSGSPAIWTFLTQQPVFVLIWFLWFLVWLLALFSIYAVAAAHFGWAPRPSPLVLSPARLLWLVPLTAVPTWMMQTPFGPDTSMGIVPMPHVLLYYAIFFFFGALYYDCDDRSNRLGGGWRWSLPVTLLGVFPLALEFAEGTFGFRDALLPKELQRPASVLLQSVFAWGMCFGSIGMFRALLTRENRLIRYLSDSSYWLYLAHLPLIIVAQAVIATWPGNAYLKLLLLSVTSIGFLLLTYQYLVRYTWIGRLLNGPRKRPEKPVNAPVPA